MFRFVATGHCAAATLHLNPLAGLTQKWAGRLSPKLLLKGKQGLKNKGMETVMKKIALTAVAVLGLGLAACQDNAADNNASTANTIETEAAADTNSALNGTDNLGAATDNALDNAGDSLGNVGNALENTAGAAGNVVEDVANGQDNVAGQ